MTGKRVLDLVVLAASAPVSVPILAALIAWVRVFDGAPVFFRQERVGQGRRRFLILKLRTMSLEADPARRRPTIFNPEGSILKPEYRKNGGASWFTLVFPPIIDSVPIFEN